MIYIVTGLPGAGKTTYVKSRMNSNDIAYDLDYISEAIVLGENKTRNSTYITNQLLKPFIKIANDNIEADVYIIRVAPTKEEIKLFDKYNSKYLNISSNYSCCYNYRKDVISLDEFTSINVRYNDYKKNNANRIQEVLLNKEKW